MFGYVLRYLDDRGLAGELELHLPKRREIDLQLRVQIESPRCLHRISNDVVVGQGSEILLAAGDALAERGLPASLRP